MRASDLIRNTGTRPDARNNLTATHIPTAKPTAPNTTPASMPPIAKPHPPSHRERAREDQDHLAWTRAAPGPPICGHCAESPERAANGSSPLRGERMAVALHQLPVHAAAHIRTRRRVFLLRRQAWATGGSWPACEGLQYRPRDAPSQPCPLPLASDANLRDIASRYRGLGLQDEDTCRKLGLACKPAVCFSETEWDGPLLLFDRVRMKTSPR